MTFDDDLIVMQFDYGTVRQPCKALGLDWPPPESIAVFGMVLKRERYSSITDEQRHDMTHVLRAAEYFPAKESP